MRCCGVVRPSAISACLEEMIDGVVASKGEEVWVELLAVLGFQIRICFSATCNNPNPAFLAGNEGMTPNKPSPMVSFQGIPAFIPKTRKVIPY